MRVLWQLEDSSCFSCIVIPKASRNAAFVHHEFLNYLYLQFCSIFKSQRNSEKWLKHYAHLYLVRSHVSMLPSYLNLNCSCKLEEQPFCIFISQGNVLIRVLSSPCSQKYFFLVDILLFRKITTYTHPWLDREVKKKIGTPKPSFRSFLEHQTILQESTISHFQTYIQLPNITTWIQSFTPSY